MSSLPQAPTFEGWSFGPTEAGRIEPARTVRQAKPNPRDSWPAWTDEFAWGPTPDDPPADDAEHRLTSGPDFIPSAEDMAASVALLNADVADYRPDSRPDPMEVSTAPDREYRAESAGLAERARDAGGGGR